MTTRKANANAKATAKTNAVDAEGAARTLRRAKALNAKGAKEKDKVREGIAREV